MIAILTAILVIVTASYAWITFKILKANEGILDQMRAQQEAMYRPYISIYPLFYQNNIILYLKIKNTGRTAANNLRLKIDRDFYQFGRKEDNRNLRKFKAFSEKIDSFVPGAEMLFFLDQGFVIFGESHDEKVTPPVFKVTAEYEFSGKKVHEDTIIDLRPYLKSVVPTDPIISKLEDIKKAIEKIK